MTRWVILPAVLLLALTMWAPAQVTVGDTSMNLNSTIAFGYTGDYSNSAGSDHGWTPSGIADLHGSYYNPNFLSFNVEPFYNQSRLDSDFQSITAAGGVNASAGIFSGSHFPGSISYSKIYNSSGNFAVPGLANYTTHGNSDNFVATWGVNLADLPNLHFSFSDGNNASSVYGANEQGTEHLDTFSAMAGYQLKGFNMNGGYQYTGTKTVTPEFLTGEPAQEANSSSNSLSFSVGHKLPWNGGFTAGVGRSSISADSEGDTYTTTIDTASGGVNFSPIRNLNVSSNVYYTNNLEGSLLSSLLSVGLPPQDVSQQSSSNSLGLTTSASYDIPSLDLHLHAFANRQQQSFLGQSFISDSYYGGVTYFHDLLGGQFTGTIGLTQTSVNTTNESLLGLNGSVSYTRRIERWTVSGAFNYSQATQTVLAAYTSSGDGYSGSLSRRFGRRSFWVVNASGAKSLLSDVPGSASSSQSFSTSLSFPVMSVSGSYSKSSGNALLTATGLVPSPVPLPVVTPQSVVLFTGKSYAVGIGSGAIRGLTISGTFSKSLSDTQSTQTISSNSSQYLNFIVVYHVRKVDFQAGYLKLNQGFSVSGGPPTMVGSYYFGIKRWFNIF
ncbi:MAG: hypothetical protein WBZ01_05225 [Terriglobales bacterium]